MYVFKDAVTGVRKFEPTCHSPIQIGACALATRIGKMMAWLPVFAFFKKCFKNRLIGIYT